MDWDVTVLGEHYRITAPFRDQEFHDPADPAAGGYWEGTTDVVGDHVTGRAYVELVGYH
jgi:hypothetical protein